MSHLPNAATARVDLVKVRDYLLRRPGKAGQFERYGFTRDDWPVLAAALQAHPVRNPVTQTTMSPHGRKFVVSCRLETPDQRNPCLRSVWIIDADGKSPRLVTAY